MLTERMMEACRGVLGLETDDTSRDDEIKTWRPKRIVEACSQWELGDPSWARVFALWMTRAGVLVEDMKNW